MQTDNRLLDDLARRAAGAAGAVQGVATEMQQAVRQQVERLLAEMGAVSREEFDAVQAMAAAARAENERLAAQVTALEARLGAFEARTAGGSSPGAPF